MEMSFLICPEMVVMLRRAEIPLLGTHYRIICNANTTATPPNTIRIDASGSGTLDFLCTALLHMEV